MTSRGRPGNAGILPASAVGASHPTVELLRKLASVPQALAGLVVLDLIAAAAVLSRCDATTMEVRPCGAAVRPAAPASSEHPDAATDVDARALWDDNQDGRITCAEARRYGIAPVPRGHPAYRYMRDGDGDGVVCE